MTATEKLELYRLRTYEHNRQEMREPAEQLEPCPFCGGFPVLLKVPAGFGLPGLCVQCVDCCAKSLVIAYNCGAYKPDECPDGEMYFRPYYEEEANMDVCTRWNARAMVPAAVISRGCAE